MDKLVHFLSENEEDRDTNNGEDRFGIAVFGNSGPDEERKREDECCN